MNLGNGIAGTDLFGGGSTTLALNQEQTNEDRDGDGNDHRRERGRIDLQTFDGAEHRDCWRDDAVAVK